MSFIDNLDIFPDYQLSMAPCGITFDLFFLIMKSTELSRLALQTATVATFEEVALKFVTVGEQVSYLYHVFCFCCRVVYCCVFIIVVVEFALVFRRMVAGCLAHVSAKEAGLSGERRSLTNYHDCHLGCRALLG